MIATLKVADPGHGRALPTGRKLQGILQAVFRRQGYEVRRTLRANRLLSAPDLSHWTEPMVELVTPLILREYRAGAAGTMQRITRQLRQQRRSYVPVFRKDVGSLLRGELFVGFDVFSPKVFNAAKNLALRFCQATNETSTQQLDAALDELRESLAVGLEQGEALKTLTERTQALFNDPRRAFTIAATESSRAMHAGQFTAARASGVATKKRWIASSDACDICLGLMAKGAIPLEEDFAVLGTGVYAAIPYPPAHPHCFCTATEVIDFRIAA